MTFVNNESFTSSGIRKKWKFSDILADTEIRERWEKVRQYFFLRESTYDISNRCNMKCEGCYYYEGDKQFADENQNPEAWRELIRKEKERGITYVVLAGAEPSLASDLCQVCYEEIPLGAIATNGLKKIPKSIGYQIHISIWGNDETSLNVRNAKNLLLKQIDNYQNDSRAVFVYTFTRTNIDEINEVAEILVKNNCRFTFNVFSPPVGHKGNLSHTDASLVHTRKIMLEILTKYPDHMLFSYYNAVAHTHKYGLHDLYSCSYPRMNPSTDIGLGRSFRQYRADLTWDRSAACCVPDTNCTECRHYAAGSAVVTARLFRHAEDPETFKSWLDYVDTYLAVWVTGYKKGKNLCDHMRLPPGQTFIN